MGGSIRSFEDLECWKYSAQLRREIATLVKKFPKCEQYLLTDQLKRASRSVTANIAEGYGRFHYQEYIQFCRQSRGSLYEIKDHLIVANEEEYISLPELENLSNKVEQCIAILNGFINYLGRAKGKNEVNEPHEGYNTDNI